MFRALHDNSPAPASVTNLIYEVQVMSYEFRRVRFSHVCKKGNVPAYLLTKHVISIDDFLVWIEKSHCFLKQTQLSFMTYPLLLFPKKAFVCWESHSNTCF